MERHLHTLFVEWAPKSKSLSTFMHLICGKRWRNLLLKNHVDGRLPSLIAVTRRYNTFFSAASAKVHFALSCNYWKIVLFSSLDACILHDSNLLTRYKGYPRLEVTLSPSVWRHSRFSKWWLIFRNRSIGQYMYAYSKCKGHLKEFLHF